MSPYCISDSPTLLLSHWILKCQNTHILNDTHDLVSSSFVLITHQTMLFLFAFSLLLCLIFVLAHFAIKLWQWSQHWKRLKVIYVPLEVPWPWSIFKSGSDQVSRLIEVSNMVPHKYFGTFLNQSPILVLNDLDMIEEVLMDNCGHFLIRNAQIGSQVLLSPGTIFNCTCLSII